MQVLATVPRSFPTSTAGVCGLVFEEHLVVTPTGDYYSFHDAGLITDPATPVAGKPLNTVASTRRKTLPPTGPVPRSKKACHRWPR
jgi:hypothetical protein